MLATHFTPSTFGAGTTPGIKSADAQFDDVIARVETMPAATPMSTHTAVELFAAIVKVATTVNDAGVALRNKLEGFFDAPIRDAITLALHDGARPMRELLPFGKQIQAALRDQKTDVNLPGYRRALGDVIKAARRTRATIKTIASEGEHVQNLLMITLATATLGWAWVFSDDWTVHTPFAQAFMDIRNGVASHVRATAAEAARAAEAAAQPTPPPRRPTPRPPSTQVVHDETTMATAVERGEKIPLIKKTIPLWAKIAVAVGTGVAGLGLVLFAVRRKG